MRLPSLVCLGVTLLASVAPVRPTDAQPASLPQPLTPLAEPAIAQPPPDHVAWWQNGGPRIRPGDARAALILRLGLERSAILRQLVDEIEGGRVIVYVVLNGDMPDRLAGSLNFAGEAGRYRYLRVSLNADLPADQIVASLAHELQHVREVMAAPEVRDDASLRSLYRRIGQESHVAGKLGWETNEARAIGVDVRRELSSGVAAILARRFDAARRAAPPR
jgi:hypothetical protein